MFGHRIHLCARCSGIYPGIAGGVLAWFLAPSAFTGFLLVALLPLPALVDWALTTFTDRRGYNVVRTATGSLLGYGYGLGLALLLADRYLSVLLVGITYAFAAVVLLYFSEC